MGILSAQNSLIERKLLSKSDCRIQALGLEWECHGSMHTYRVIVSTVQFKSARTDYSYRRQAPGRTSSLILSIGV
jgi:hypothetical protein